MKNWVSGNYLGDGSQRGSKDCENFEGEGLGNSGVGGGSGNRGRDAVSDILKNAAKNFGGRARKTYSRVSDDNYSSFGDTPTKTLKSKKGSINSQ